MTTRERLLREGLRLFSERGFVGTSVGDIEEAAGLQPRRGALYRHFASKEALLEAAVEHYNDLSRAAAVEFTQAEVDDPRALARTVGRWLLDRLDDQRLISHVLERDGDRLPELRDRFRAGTDVGFAAAAAVVRQWTLAHHPRLDAEVVGVTLVGGLVNFRRSAWTLGRPPLGLEDDRFLAGVADLFAALTA